MNPTLLIGFMPAMTFGRTVLLGAIAGSTIFVGLPLGRLRNPRPRLKAMLNAISAGILLFLLFDILSNATEPLERLVTDAVDGSPQWSRFAGLASVYVLGLGVGLLSLLYLGKYQRSRRSSPSIGPGAMAVAEANEVTVQRHALQLGMSIAAGIGLHNFSEGLAIGQAAHKGEISLAVLLVVGFALHNATEGFGIVGPLAAGGVRASWSYLATAGLIAGGPTFVGTIVGQAWVNDAVNVVFLTLAAGSILYVVVQLVGVALRAGHKEMLYWGVFLGMVAGFATDFVVTAAGV
jgi:ZIP family zinc transporter